MRLAILGASARAAAASARAARFEVVAADLFADWDLASWAEATRIADWPEGFAPWLEQQHLDGWLYTGGLENYPDLVDRLAALRPCWGNRGSGLREVRSPERLAAALASGGGNYPAICTSHVRANSARRWLVKSQRSAGGLGVEVWDGASALTRGTYLQEPIEGRPISAVYVTARGQSRLLGVTEQLIGRSWTRAGRFQYAGSVGPFALTTDQRQAAHRVGECLAREFQLVGLMGIDLVVDPAGVLWVVDVNPRYTASMEVIEKLRGDNLVLAHTRACRGELPRVEPLQVEGTSIGKAYLFARQGGTISSAFHHRMKERAEEGLAADVPHAGTGIRAGDPVTTLFAYGDSPHEVERQLEKLTQQIEQELHH